MRQSDYARGQADAYAGRIMADYESDSYYDGLDDGVNAVMRENEFYRDMEVEVPDFDPTALDLYDYGLDF